MGPVDGLSLGSALGPPLGFVVVKELERLVVGGSVLYESENVPPKVTKSVGRNVVTKNVGLFVGPLDGLSLGSALGVLEGESLGMEEGLLEGE